MVWNLVWLVIVFYLHYSRDWMWLMRMIALISPLSGLRPMFEGHWEARSATCRTSMPEYQYGFNDSDGISYPSYPCWLQADEKTGESWTPWNGGHTQEYCTNGTNVIIWFVYLPLTIVWPLINHNSIIIEQLIDHHFQPPFLLAWKCCFTKFTSTDRGLGIVATRLCLWLLWVADTAQRCRADEWQVKERCTNCMWGWLATFR